MHAERRGSNHAPTLAVSLDAGESLTVEAGNVVDYTPGIAIDRQDPDGLHSIATRGDIPAISLATITAETRGSVRLAPPLPGTIIRQAVGDTPLFIVQPGSFLATDTDVTVDGTREDSPAFVSGEGLFMLHLSGRGPVFLAGYGGVDRIRLGPGESRTVNTGHVVAFQATLGYDVARVEGMKSTVFGNAGLTCTFEGPGQLWTQTRSHDAFLSWLSPHLPD